jgi:hypothetical protein
MTTEQIINELKKMEGINYSAPKICTKNARTRLEDLEQALAKTIQQRDSLITKLEKNQHFISKRIKPLRLEIAAMCLQGLLASGGTHIDTAKIAMKYADNLIAESQCT